MSGVEEPATRVYLLTLGCPKNDADSRSVRRILSEAGIAVVDDSSLATHILVNTCGFIQDAKEESIETILATCRDHPDKEVLAMGCLVERYRDDLARGIPEVSGWLGLVSAQTTQEVLRKLGEEGGPRQPGSSSSGAPRGSYAYLKISDGCDESCTFCAIPGIKGGYTSASMSQILEEAELCLAEGARELVLVGQDTTRWRDGSVDLRGLIDTLSSDDRVRRIRVMYLQPTRLDDGFLEFMAGHPKLCRYLDVPFQHSHPSILRKMGRRGDGGSYADLLRRARAMMSSVATRSTFIVGFPGEEVGHFEDLFSFVAEAGFDYGGAFIYSPEEGTSAESLRPRVGKGVAVRRLERLTELLLQGGIGRREALLGSEVEVMIDSTNEDEVIYEDGAVGRTEGQAPEVDGVTYVTGLDTSSVATGDIVKVRVTEVLGCDLIGEVCAS